MQLSVVRIEEQWVWSSSLIVRGIEMVDLSRKRRFLIQVSAWASFVSHFERTTFLRRTGAEVRVEFVLAVAFELFKVAVSTVEVEVWMVVVELVSSSSVVELEELAELASSSNTLEFSTVSVEFEPSS